MNRKLYYEIKKYMKPYKYALYDESNIFKY